MTTPDPSRTERIATELRARQHVARRQSQQTPRSDPAVQQIERDILTALLRRARAVDDVDQVVDPRGAADIFVEHLVPVLADELDRRGYVCRPSETLVSRLRPLRPIGSLAAGALGGVLVIAMIVLLVWGLTK
jgi:hypothetical protein